MTLPQPRTTRLQGNLTRTIMSQSAENHESQNAKRSRHWRGSPKPGSPKDLRIKTAEETAALIPDLLSSLQPTPPDSTLLRNPEPLIADDSPKLGSALVKVVNQDTLDAALSLLQLVNASTDKPTMPPLVLNMASEKNPGGGWMHGTTAQEEAICYRSSLSATLHKRFYPIRSTSAIYSPHVLVLRESMGSGHKLLDISDPAALEVLSIVSMPAIRHPKLAKQTGEKGALKEVYADMKDEEVMRTKMRIILRIAGKERHHSLVLGALGCGAFHNPRHEVMRLWKIVLKEDEWKGWFENIVFAVFDTRGEGNFEVFRDGLEGMSV